MDVSELHKKLIPVNVVIMVLALAAAITILFLPLLEVNFGKRPDLIDDVVDSMVQEEPQEGGFSDDIKDALKESLKKTGVSISGITFYKLNKSEDPLGLLAGEIAKRVGDVADKTFVTAILNEAAQTAKEYGGGKVGDADSDKIYNQLKDLETSNTPNEAMEDIAQGLADEFSVPSHNMADFKREVVNVLKERYDATVASAGQFSVEAMVCVTLFDSSDGEKITSYESLIKSSLGSSEEEVQSINSTLHTVGVIAFWSTAAFSILWLLLFASALIHTLLKNKKVALWYVKATGWIPCFLFGVLPMIITAVYSRIGDVSPLSALTSLLSTTTWISGVCWLLLNIISIVWAHPIKKKIRAASKVR